MFPPMKIGLWTIPEEYADYHIPSIITGVLDKGRRERGGMRTGWVVVVCTNCIAQIMNATTYAVAFPAEAASTKAALGCKNSYLCGNIFSPPPWAESFENVLFCWESGWLLVEIHYSQALLCVVIYTYRISPDGSMRVNLNQLHIFYLTARYKNMKKTAAYLYVSPPAVTMQIKKLEDWLGFPVFERSQGELKLTERGQGLYEAVDSIFNNIGELEQYIQNLVYTERRELRFGTHHLPGNYFIPDLIAHVHTRYPDLNVQMELGTQDKLLEKLFEQELDLALIIGDPPKEANCKTVHLFDMDLPLVTSPEGDFAEIGSISLAELHRIPLIIQQKGSGVLRAVRDFFKRHNVEPNILLANLSSDVIKQFLPKKQAGAFIGRFIVQKELNEGTLQEITVHEGLPVCRFNLVYIDTQHLPLKIRQFLAGLEGFLPLF